MNKKQREKYYFSHPEVWESGNQQRYAREVRFLHSLFKKFGKVHDVLDVGCGTGGHLNGLLDMGYEGLGIDLSPNMIRYARTTYPRAAFETGDMRKLKYRQRFDAVISLCTTFSFNITNQQVVAALASMRRALRKKGLLVLECFNPIAFIQGISFQSRVEERTRFAAVNLCSVNEHRVDHVDQLLLEKRTIYRLSSGRKLQSDHSKLRLFFPQELRYFLESCGFDHLAFYGDYSNYRKLDRFRMIVVARKAD